MIFAKYFLMRGSNSEIFPVEYFYFKLKYFLPGNNLQCKKELQMKTRIKELRLEKKLTQESLAKYLGINQATVSKLENESTIPDATLLIRLSRFFHVSTDYVLYLSEQRLSADLLLADNMHLLKKYQHLISLYQKMSPLQQQSCYRFLDNMLDDSHPSGL